MRRWRTGRELRPGAAPARHLRAAVGIGLACVLLAACGTSTTASPPTTAAPTAAQKTAVANGADLSRTDTTGTEWLCRPGQALNPCLFDQTTQVVGPKGSSTIQRSSPAKSPAIDCFYIYPTVSAEQTVQANLTVQKQETDAAVAQASRFSSVCRVYAPVYPQVTVYGLEHPPGNPAPYLASAYAVVQKAWQDYLANDNHGRGVVIIGHSQGSAMAINLLQTQIDPNPSELKLLVSAIIPGGNAVVPVGKTVGGSFQHIPTCTSSTELHCVIAYSSFETTPTSSSLFGIPGAGVSLLNVTPQPTAGMQVVCVDPSTLSTRPTGPSGLAQPYFLRAGTNPQFPPTATKDPTAPWFSEPGLYSAQCQYQNGISWLAVSGPVTAGDTRPLLAETLGPSWGLHLVDINLFLGNLVPIVQSQVTAYLK